MQIDNKSDEYKVALILLAYFVEDRRLSKLGKKLYFPLRNGETINGRILDQYKRCKNLKKRLIKSKSI